MTVTYLACLALGYLIGSLSVSILISKYIFHQDVRTLGSGNAGAANAARTLGARDARIMFRHIFPNALGTLVTGQILVIPGMIFSESSLSYLGIINLNTGDLTSVGTLLANAEPYLHTYPYLMFSPALFISLLMLSFNLFGNGLRDAFNPSLRGAED